MSTLTPSFVQSGPLDDVLSAVTSATDAQLKQIDRNNQTLLHGACARVDGLPIVILLLKRGLDGNVVDAHGQTPLRVAKGELVQNNSSCGIFYNFSPGAWIPPSSACSSAVPFLEKGTVPSFQDVFPFFVQSGSLSVLKFLFTESTQSDKEWVKDNANVVLGKAIESNNFEVFKHLLVVWDVPFDQSSKEAEVLLMGAVRGGKDKCVEGLLSVGVSVPSSAALTAAVESGSGATVRVIIDSSGVSLAPELATTLCVSAILSGKKGVAMVLAQTGGITATSGVAALHAAIEKDDMDLTKYLVESIKVHIKAKHNGKTALEVASEQKRTAISAYLQEAVLEQPLTVPAAAPRPTPAALAPAQPSTPTPKGKNPDDKPAPGPSTPAPPATTPSKPTPQAPLSSLALTDKGKALLGDWAVAAQLDLMARVRSVCTEETSSPSAPSTLPDLPSITSLVSDHLQAITKHAGTPWTAEVSATAHKSQSLAQAMADLSALRDELSSDKPGKSLRVRISEVPTHDSDEVQALRDSLLAQIQTARKFDPNIPRSALVLEEDSFDEGAFSEVFHGTFDGAPIVAKVFRTAKMDAEKLKAEVANEAAMMAKCQHPNIVRSYGVCADFTKKKPFVALVLDSYPEGSLANVLKKTGPLPGLTAAHILEGVAWGLDALHRQGIVHKDLKTDNILVERDSEDGVLHGVVADFGLSVDLAFTSAQYNLAGGTWTYQAPEQLKPCDDNGKDLRITSKVDMYAFGVVSWVLATNKVPWEGETPMGIAQRVVDLKQRPTFPAAPDPAWQTIQALALRCFETDPEKRPTAQEAAKELSKLH